MFKRAGSSGELNGFLDAGSHMNGELRFEDTFRVEGKLTGKIVSEGELIVGEGGDVDGEVIVRRVLVTGTLRGVVRSSERIEITRGGRVWADLHTPALSIEEGAFFEGRCAMGRPKKPVQPVAAAEARQAEPSKVAQMPIAKG